jgi:hypothetical protein
MSTSEGPGGIRMSIFRPLMTFNRRPEDIRSWHIAGVRRHVRSWRKPTPHSRTHPLVNRLNLALVRSTHPARIAFFGG